MGGRVEVWKGGRMEDPARPVLPHLHTSTLPPFPGLSLQPWQLTLAVRAEVLPVGPVIVSDVGRVPARVPAAGQDVGRPDPVALLAREDIRAAGDLHVAVRIGHVDLVVVPRLEDLAVVEPEG